MTPSTPWRRSLREAFSFSTITVSKSLQWPFKIKIKNKKNPKTNREAQDSVRFCKLNTVETLNKMVSYNDLIPVRKRSNIPINHCQWHAEGLCKAGKPQTWRKHTSNIRNYLNLFGWCHSFRGEDFASRRRKTNFKHDASTLGIKNYIR